MLNVNQFMPVLLSGLEKIVPSVSTNADLQNAVKDIAPKVLDLLKQKPDARQVLEQLSENMQDPALQKQLMNHVQTVVKDNMHLAEPLMKNAGLSGMMNMAKGLF